MKGVKTMVAAVSWLRTVVSGVMVTTNIIIKQMMYTLRVRSANAVTVIILCVEKSVNKHMLWKSLYIASAVLHCPQYYILWQVYEYS